MPRRKAVSENFSMNAAHFQEAIRSVQEREGRSRMLKAVRKKRAYEDIVRQIHDLIEKGKIEAGRSASHGEGIVRNLQGLPGHGSGSHLFPGNDEARSETPGQRDLCDRLQRRSPGPAPGARPLSEKDDIIDIFSLRKIIEPEVAQLAAENATAEEIEELEEILREQEDEVTVAARKPIRRFDFHHLLARMAKNRVLERLLLPWLIFLSETRESTSRRRKESADPCKAIMRSLPPSRGQWESRAKGHAPHLEDVENIVFKKKRGGGKKSSATNRCSWKIEISLTQDSFHRVTIDGSN